MVIQNVKIKIQSLENLMILMRMERGAQREVIEASSESLMLETR